jgi:hypothetical protein
MLNFCEAFCFNIPALYIRAYDELIVKQTVSSTSGTDASDGGERPLRLDNPADGARIEAWIAQGQDVKLHLTGVGCLDGHNSPKRIVYEVQRIAMRTGSRSPLAHCLAVGLRQTLLGRPLRAQDLMDD